MPLSPELMKYVEPHYPSDWTDLDVKPSILLVYWLRMPSRNVVLDTPVPQ